MCNKPTIFLSAGIKLFKVITSKVGYCTNVFIPNKRKFSNMNSFKTKEWRKSKKFSFKCLFMHMQVFFR